MKQRILLGATIAVVIASALAGVACGESGGGGGTGRTPVVATTVQVGALTREVGGDRIALTVLVGPGVDPHNFEASPGDLKKISSAKAVLRNGLGLDNWLDGAIRNAGGSTKVVTVTDGIELREGSAEERKDDPNAKDPHVWHSPANDKIMLDNIATALAAADPGNAATYRANADAARQRFDDVDKQIRALIDGIPAANRKLVTDHDAFGYFLDRYGLTLIGTVIPGNTTQSEPSAKAIADLEDTIRREGVKAIFSEGTADPKVGRQVAADTGVRIINTLYGDSLGKEGSGQETVEGMLLFNAKTIAEALK
ncbi:MAG: zinc ABC transporter substrate-binding protein [Chloroflexi bacterium]|nr:zinc ABC transporter substrate-binding protein [Chloroflexota bacterium]